jgi:exopolyphosphatase/guanosine-5'-triphosphate,3'-diphosphate pyrophosphatase
MGCVNMTEDYFPGGKLSKRHFDNARMAAQLKLRPVKAFFRDATDIEAVGCSGTILSTENVARQVGAIESNDLSPAAVEELIERVIRFDTIDKIDMDGLSTRRAQVWPGGLAILVELMRVLRIERLRVSDGALREGLLYDHIGRLHQEDARERSVKAMARRYNVDTAQAERVAETASALLAQVSASWKLESELAGQVLRWAASLHEIGLDIAHIDFQKHGAYIAAHADLPGFPRSEQQVLAFLVATQRSDLQRSALRGLPSKWRKPALRLSILLRLAVLLNRSRSNSDLPDVVVTARKNRIELDFPDDWLDANPLTVMDLEREQKYLAAIGHKLEFG